MRIRGLPFLNERGLPFLQREVMGTNVFTSGDGGGKDYSASVDKFPFAPPPHPGREFCQ